MTTGEIPNAVHRDIEPPDRDVPVTAADAKRSHKTAEVLRLLDESFRAHRRGDQAASDHAAAEACRLDVDCVTVIQGGIFIGEIPNPERDPSAWADYVQAAQEQADEDQTPAQARPATSTEGDHSHAQ